jgi:nucleotide-binding universal stress UspA family protein
MMPDPVAALRESSKSAQSLVVGNRGRGGFLGALLGSMSNSLVQHAHCPVMVVHPPKRRNRRRRDRRAGRDRV